MSNKNLIDFELSEKKNFILRNPYENDYLYPFIIISVIVSFLLLLIPSFKSFKFSQKIISKFFSLSFQIKTKIIKIYHIMFLIIFLYVILYFKLKSKYFKFRRTNNETFFTRLERINKKFVVENEIWLVFFVIVCLLAVYRNAILFNNEKYYQELFDDNNKKLKESKK